MTKVISAQKSQFGRPKWPGRNDRADMTGPKWPVFHGGGTKEIKLSTFVGIYTIASRQLELILCYILIAAKSWLALKRKIINWIGLIALFNKFIDKIHLRFHVRDVFC